MAATRPTVAVVQATFTELASVSQAVVEAAIATAESLSSASTESWLYCTGHVLALLDQNTGEADGGSGEVMSEKIGPKLTSYKTQAKGNREAFFTQTSYGRMVLTLEKRNPEIVLGMFSA